MNPLTGMPQISGMTSAQKASFNSSYAEYNSHIRAMKTRQTSAAATVKVDGVKEFRKALEEGDHEAAVKAFAHVYPDIDKSTKTLLEASIDYVNVVNVDLVNLIFARIPEYLTPLNTVLFIRELCSTFPKNPSNYQALEQGDLTIEQMIAKAGNRCNQDYVNLHYCDQRYHTYPLYLLINAPDKSGKSMHYVESETQEDIKLSDLLR